MGSPGEDNRCYRLTLLTDPKEEVFFFFFFNLLLPDGQNKLDTINFLHLAIFIWKNSLG